MNYLAIFIGGGIGSVLRFFTTSFFKNINFYNFPLGTFFSNIIASFLLGLIVGFFISQKVENEMLRNFLLIGICGGFSTFSTFSFENFTLIQQNNISMLIFYTSISIVFSLAFIQLGLFLSNRIQL